MSKPDWKDAPDWAMWLAQDEVGIEQDNYWVWFECEPDFMHCGWADYGIHGRWLQTSNIATEEDWQSTLEPRP